MSSSKKCVCIHGHFYQPPRENPWLETVETQDSAAPYHDWNERVCAECYAPNGAARIVNIKNQITHILNNYGHISFNFGPTLLSWLQENAPRTYRMILDGERRSRARYQGHSSAMAQVYNHIIMPLASTRDRITQIRWGITVHQRTFGIFPEGMWLAETAADSETLELLANEGIKFTLLAPHQCKRIRALERDGNKTDDGWVNTPGDSVDTSRPYLVRFKSGASITVFFYNGAVSRGIAFEGLLNSGENFESRLKTGFSNQSTPQLMHVATDGESYGHHHKYGEMALAYAIRLLDEDKTIEVTNYGSFLERFPPQYECEIVEDTSWSCAHGVERWRSNCGCNGGKPGWTQEWRTPLRAALDQLRDAIVPLTEREGNRLFRDVWAARDAYVNVVLDRSTNLVDRFLKEQARRELTEEERVSALELMELQRHAQLMYTSCGWFFDDISGIETVQVIAYAARVLQLAKRLFKDESLEPAFLAQLALAKSNVASAGDGASIYRKTVAAMEVQLEQVAAHYAISSVFSSFAEETDLFCFHLRRISYEVATSGRGRLAVGRVNVRSLITGDRQSFSFAVLHFGDQNISAAVKPYNDRDAEAFMNFAAQAIAKVEEADFPKVIRLFDQHFGSGNYSLTSLFSDEQRRIVQLILNSTLWDIENSLATIYQDHASLLHFLSQAGLPKPPALTMAASFAINAGLRRVLESEPIDLAQMRAYLALAKGDQVQLDTVTLSYIVDQRMKRAMVELQTSGRSLEILERALHLGRAVTELPFELNLWQAQNIWYEILRNINGTLNTLSGADRARWDKAFNELGACLAFDTRQIRVDEKVSPAIAD
jgi:alpha-amylase/alpha-mannosidase (GH57 family)